MLNPSPQPFAGDDPSYISSANLYNNIAYDHGYDFGASLIGGGDVTASTSSSSSLASWCPCICFQNHAEIVCQFRELEQRQAAPRLDSTMACVQQAMLPWQDVIQCPVCRNDDKYDFLILSTNIVHTLLQALSTLCADIYRSSSSSSRERRKQLAQVKPPASLKSAFGVFDVAGSDQLAVTDFLVHGTMDKVKQATSCFRERMDAISARKSANPAMSSQNNFLPWPAIHDVNLFPKGMPGSLDHLIHLWQDVESSVKSLEEVVKKRKRRIAMSSPC